MFFNKSRIFLVLTSLFLSSCDFRVPQEWETPSWEFDLLIPLINEDYSMASIASNSNDIQITVPDSSNFIIELKESVIDSGYVKTDESFFLIPSNDLDFDLESNIFDAMEIYFYKNHSFRSYSGTTIVKNPNILIFDEATSALDSKSEQKIQDAMVKVIKDRTVIIIAHRLSTIKNADKILVFDNGKIIESGNHSELIKLNGKYTQLCKIQFGDSNV